ncbi:MAG TPA: Hsp70 family protein [Chloroflexia bacterium]|nr:Hsp70 family protein [Chloroflexia bacterium]
MAEIVGIDLGTTKSAIAVWQNGAPQIIPDAQGRRIMPSVVARDPATGQWLVGHAARAIAENQPGAAIYAIKRLMGRRYEEETVQADLAQLEYRVAEAGGRQVGVKVVLGDQQLTPQEISAKILQQLKATAEAYLGHPVREAVITVPAYFHDSQRQATRDAGRIAGLQVRQVLNEPTAACLAFGYQKMAEERRTVAVYDLGGGTFDISILDVGRGKPFRVRATNGDTHLGSSDLDLLIVAWVLKRVGGGEKAQLATDLVARAHLRAAAERAKIALSEQPEALIQVPGALSPTAGIQDLAIPLSRADLEEIAQPLIARTLQPCRQALEDAKRLGPYTIQEVLLVGGPTRMPAIRQAVGAFFGVEPNASVQPEEVVALGAAVQGAILAGAASGLILADVVPLTLGVRTQGGRMEPLIHRNTPVPIAVTRSYSTATDNQEFVEVEIYQGERPLVAANQKLGSLLLQGIQPARQGEPNIEVKFDVDEDGILRVSATDTHTGNTQQTTITDAVRLSEEEIQALIQDAGDPTLP